MRDLVKKLAALENLVSDADVNLVYSGEHLKVNSAGAKFSFEVVNLIRPSVAQIKANASDKRLLILNNPSIEAVAAAHKSNYIVLPDGGFRIVAPGLMLLREAPSVKANFRQVRLRGASGVVAETLLLGAGRAWSVDKVAREARVSNALAHRVLQRLELENLVRSYESGPNKTRRVIDANALAQTWRDEEAAPNVMARGYLYGATLSAVIARAAEICPQGAMGGVIAANHCEPMLTQIPSPVRLWAPFDFPLVTFEQAGLEITDEGANLEIAVARSDGWQAHRISVNGLPTVSRWRAWMELGDVRGRIGELAERLLHKLIDAEATEEMA